MVSLPFYDPVSIGNRALREVPDRAIASFEENSLQARECALAYPDCVAELLEDSPWEFATARQTLATLTNDRSGEWGYAYAVPADAAFVGRIMASGLSTGGAIAGAQIVAEWTDFRRGPDVASDFTARASGFSKLVVGGTIYTDSPGAVAEYTLNTLPESRFTASFVRALALRIAVRITPALKKAEASRDLIGREELAVGRAKATNGNRLREVYGDYIPDWMAIR